MKICNKCKVTILDDTELCPLCRHALAGEEGGLRSYPDAIGSIKKARMLENIVLFLSLVAATAMIITNILVDASFLWSFIGVLALVYVNAVLRIAILGRSGYQAKVYGLVFLALLILLGIDYITGFRGWSLAFVFPGGIMGVDLALLILMLVNRRNWQSYMLPQLVMFLLSLLSILFVLVGWNRHPLVGLIASAVTLFVFLGTLILGDRRARDEMKRRFHI